MSRLILNSFTETTKTQNSNLLNFLYFRTHSTAYTCPQFTPIPLNKPKERFELSTSALQKQRSTS